MIPRLRGSWPQAGMKLEPGELLTAARTVVSGDVTATAALHEGRARVQDEGSQLDGGVRREAPAESRAKTRRKFSMLARRRAARRSFSPSAIPRRSLWPASRARSGWQQLRERLAAYAGRVECRLADAAALKKNAAFDLALADVPCSGTGTLGRNPEIRHRLRAGGFAAPGRAAAGDSARGCCARCERAGAWSIRPARWSRRRMSRL